MKINAILPFLIPVAIAGGLIGYNETNNNILLTMLSNNSSPQIQNITEENQKIKVSDLNTDEISNTTNSFSSSELAEGFVLSEIPADAQCQVGTNNNYIVCTSLSELMDYFRNVPVKPQELQYKNHTKIDYYPFPDKEINKTPNRFGSTASAGGQGNYKELRKSLMDASVGYFDIHFEEKNVNSNTNTNVNETDVSDKIEESSSEISNSVEKADFILDKVNYVRTLNDPKEINISEQDYTTFVSNYEYLINNNGTISQLKINDTDLKKIQDAASYAPIVISLIENR